MFYEYGEKYFFKKGKGSNLIFVWGLYMLFFIFVKVKEVKWLKEFLEDYDDDRDDSKYYR